MKSVLELRHLRDNCQDQLNKLSTRNQQLASDINAITEHHQLLVSQRNAVIGEMTAASAALQAFTMALGDDAVSAPPSEPPPDRETQ